ncbi:MAG: FMN adenylyltransferase / Riboflavin kinase [Rhodanobacteraceae bacterium]|jgi:riboflavin kinase/FMN adenylyltransferase|nr:MAG: FMN adenylyltransferase / Riboflavin kinase [Rhodanobacteraceae bacterium]
MLRIHRDIAGPCLAPGGCVLAIGAFDGLHRGHAALLAKVRERANARGLVAAAVSFEPLPRGYFSPVPLKRLSSVREKLCGFADAGIEQLLLLRFNACLVAMSAEDFVREVLVARMGAREIWVGKDFRFGHNRTGDAELLEAMQGEGPYEVRVLDAVSNGDGERVSASRIRGALAAGDFAHAEALLGRPFAISGRVVRGQRMGHKLGYPTANIRLGKRVSPVSGIFAVRVHVGDKSWPGVASLGVRPTIAGGGEPLLEAHLFDFNGDLYGQRIEVEFVAKLRDEEKFDGLDALRAQMDLDAAAARRILADTPVSPGVTA